MTDLLTLTASAYAGTSHWSIYHPSAKRMCVDRMRSALLALADELKLQKEIAINDYADEADGEAAFGSLHAIETWLREVAGQR